MENSGMNKQYNTPFVGATVPGGFAAFDGNATASAPGVFLAPSVITGRALGRLFAGLSVAQRAVAAAAIAEGERTIKNVTLGQLARISDISRSSLDHARNLSVTSASASCLERGRWYTPCDVMQVVDAYGPDLVMAALDVLTMPKKAAN
jgi:hypothetical protein